MNDTSPEIADFQKNMLRKASLSERFARVRSLTQSTIQLSRRAIARNHPDLDQYELNLLFVTYHYSSELSQDLDRFLRKRGQ